MTRRYQRTGFWLLAFISIGAVGVASEADWNDNFVAPVATGLGGYATELAPIPGTAEFGIADSLGNGAVRYFQGAGAAWTSHTVATDSLAALRIGLAFEPGTNVPHVAYPAADGRLLVAYLQGASWMIEDTLTTGTREGCSIAFNPVTGEPAVAGGSGDALWYAWRDGTGWHVETVDSGFAAFHEPSLRFDPVTGEPCVTWARTFQGAFFARRRATGWQVDQVEALTFPYETILRFDPVHHAPQVVYRLGLNGPINYAVQRQDGWTTSSVTTDDVWFRIGFANQVDGTPWVVYPRGGAGTTKLVVRYLQDAKWVTWDLFDTGPFHSLAGCALAQRDDTLFLSYHAGGIGLHLASRSVPTVAGARVWPHYQ